ncbi:MAG: thiopeptide-type bacteriocin biosynthesis protein [Bacteroidota bacterium]
MLQRSFIPGSEWLYYKIYLGPKTMDAFLVEEILPLIGKLKQEKLTEKWFYIRYADPKQHLRIRFLVKPGPAQSEIINLLHDALQSWINEDLIWKVQLDTYNRELERYGTNTMELSETLFQHDSEATLQFLDMIEGDEGEQLRWLFGLRALDHLLGLFNYTIHEKLNTMDILKTAFGKEFGMARPLKKQLDEKFRKERKNIGHFMEIKQTDELYGPIISVLHQKERMLHPAVSAILHLKAKNSLQLAFDNLMASHIHMLMNRLFKSKNRLNEMVCYDFLYRYYKSKMAIDQAKTIPPVQITNHDFKNI